MKKCSYVIGVLFLLSVSAKGRENTNVGIGYGQLSTSDTIPFTIGELDHGIHLRVRVNNSDTLDFLFDTGANAVVLTTSVSKRIGVKVDGSVENTGVDGRTMKQTSLGNTLDIEGSILENVELVLIDYPAPTFDGVLGWVAFNNKYLEIDYENLVMIVHDEIEEIPSIYKKLDTERITERPFVNTRLKINDREVEGRFLFDTGSSGALSLSQKFGSENDLVGKMRKIGSTTGSGSAGKPFEIDILILPELQLAQFEVYEIPLTINVSDPNGSFHNGILGNRLLKRFNTILDFRNFEIYIKPNSLMHSPYLTRKPN